jgi:hypothetical protein
MTSIARRHHYLPQAYLAAFTDTGKKDGRLNVIDTCSGTCFRTLPKNVAVERDFNRIDFEGKSPDDVEKAFSPFEERAGQAIRNVKRTNTFPDNEDYNFIINLLCLIAVRNPRLRKSFNLACELVHHKIVDILVSDKKILDQHLKKAQEEGYIRENNVTFEEMKRFIEERRYEIQFAPENNIIVEFHAFEQILQLLWERTWSLFIAPSPGPEFICSDHPVVLTWKSSANRGPIGYGLKNTEVFFPLTPRTGFYGVYEEPLLTVVYLKPAQVAMMNTRIAQSAERHMFSAMETFFLWDKGAVLKVDCKSIFRH